jgi:hypothetical protein
MYLVGARGQTAADRTYRLDGTITTASTPQLVSPIATSRAFFVFQNNSTALMTLEFGSARATATIAGGQVTAVNITNPGFGFLAPPIINFLGGAPFSPRVETGPSGAGLPGYAAPSYANTQNPARPALALATITAGALTGITITDPGAGYAFAPFVDIVNDYRDRYGCAAPSLTSGMQIQPSGGSYYVNGTVCPLDQISVFCATAGAPFLFKWAG